MNSDAENIPPERGLLPIRKLSSLIPLRKAARYQLSDPRDGSAFPALKTSTNTFQSSIPIKVAEKRVERTSDSRKDKQSTKTKMTTKPTYAKLPASLNIHTTPRLPMSPPPEEELREQEKSLRKQSLSKADASFPSPTHSSGSRKRARSIVRANSPNPKARKQPKLQKHDSYGDDPIAHNWEQYSVPLKSSHDVETGGKSKKSRGSEPALRESSFTKESKGNRKESTGSRRRSSPPRSRSRLFVTHSRSATPAYTRPATPVIIRTVPPPDIESLPPPAPPSPSDDPLWLPPPPPRRRPDDSITYSRHRTSHANSHRAVSPTPAPRPRVSKAAPPNPVNDEDVSMMDAASGWDDMPSGADFVVPLHFDSSHSATAPIPDFFPKSPRKGTPLRARPGSPWLRSPGALGREDAVDDTRDNNVGVWGFAPLQDAPSDDSDNEVDQPQEIIASRVDIPPTKFYSAAYDDNHGPEEVANAVVPSSRADVEIAPRGRSTTVSPLSRGNNSQHHSKIVTPARSSSPAPTSGFSGGKTLSQRFAELGNKLAAEGRSFRFSEIGALPSSPAVGDEYMRTGLKFPDLPGSSPDKLTANEGEQEQDESRVENDLSSEAAEEEEQAQRHEFSRQEVPAESGLNEYSSQRDSEHATSMDEPDYLVELQPLEESLQESAERSYQESTEIVAAAVTNTSWQSAESVQNAGVVEADVEEQSDWYKASQALDYSDDEEEPPVWEVSRAPNPVQPSEQQLWDASMPLDSVQVDAEEHEQFLAVARALDSPIRSPTISVQNDEQDASFISPIRPKNSPPMPVDDMDDSELGSSDESDEDNMHEGEIMAESTYEQDVQPQNLSSLIEDQPDVRQGPSPSRRSVPVELAETTGDQDVEYDETIEEEMVHGPSWEDETDAEPLVQIRSNDPMAAARAAAILNLHHEYIQGTPKRQDTSSVWGSSRRRSTSVMRTPMEITEPRSSQIFATPSRRGGDTSQLAPSPVIHAAPVRPSAEPEWRRIEVTAAPVVLEWTKREWRCLEQCFTDIRMEAAQSLDVDDIDPEEVDLDDVVVRFVESYGVGVKLDGEWKWEKMRRRALALVGRQREGKARGLESAITSPTQSVFTPARPTVSAFAPAVRVLQPTPDPLGSTSTLHAQYAHLTQERGVSPSVTNSPTPVSQSRPERSRSRDMPPPSYLPARSLHNPKPVASQALYPPLPPHTSSKPYQIPPSTPLGRVIKQVPEPTSASRKMWNWMGSFLKAGSEPPASENGEPRELIPSLPPTSDADREALRHVPPQPPKPKERIVAPKDQVQLQHVPTPVPIRIPRTLNHKGSSGSVKDMIKSFESISDTDSLRKNMSATRPFVVKKASTGSLSARSMDSSNEWSREQSQSGIQDTSVGSVRSVRSMVQNYSPAPSQQPHAAGRVHVGSFRMGDGTRW